MFKLIKLKAVLGDDLFNKLKKSFDEETPEKTETAAATESVFVALADGSGKITGTIAEGETVQFAPNEGEPTPVPDGDYTLEDGTVISCSNSQITKVTAAAPAETPMTENEVLAAIQTALSKQEAVFKAELKTIADANTKLIADNKEAFAAFAEALELFAELKKEAPEKKDDLKGKFAQQKAEGFDKLQKALQNIKK